MNTDPILSFPSAEDWSAWLAGNHASSSGIWMKISKKGASSATVTYADALEEALCFGWIDGQKRPLDAEHWLQRFVPRTSRSIWSRINREKVEKLVAAGRMQPAGHAAVEQARKNGRWDLAYDSPGRSTVPPDLQVALSAAPAAQVFFETLDKGNRYAVLFRIQTARNPETRARKIARLVEMLARGEKIHP